MLTQIKLAVEPFRRALSQRLKKSFLGTMFDNYQPELHYMRGPGPKSRSLDAAPSTGAEQA